MPRVDKTKIIDEPAFKLGVEEGISRGYEKVLQVLHDNYLSDELEDPSTPEGQANLALAKVIAEDLRKKLAKAEKKRLGHPEED